MPLIAHGAGATFGGMIVASGLCFLGIEALLGLPTGHTLGLVDAASGRHPRLHLCDRRAFRRRI